MAGDRGGPRTIVSCSASSEFSSDYGCQNVYDGVLECAPTATGSSDVGSAWATLGEGVGSWIELRFDAAVTIHRMAYVNRLCFSGDEQNTGLTLRFSDGSSTDVEIPSTVQYDLSPQNVTFPVVATEFVRIEVTSVGGTANNGAQEIQFFGPSPAVLFR